MNCIKCGTRLEETNWGKYFCPNCGFIEENQVIEEETKKEVSYIG